MKDIEEVFNYDYMEKRLCIAWRKAVVCAAIIKVFRPLSVVDVGCSVGELVQGYIDRGIDAQGIDGSTAIIPHLQTEEKNIVIKDLRKPVKGISANLATCFEVYTIFEDEYKKQLLKNIVKMSDRVLIGAAEGQRGELIDAMAKLKYDYLPDGEAALKKELESLKHKPAIKAIYHNSMYFEAR